MKEKITFECDKPGCTKTRTESKIRYEGYKHHFCSSECNIEFKRKKVQQLPTHCNRCGNQMKDSDRLLNMDNSVSPSCYKCRCKSYSMAVENKKKRRLEFVNRFDFTPHSKNQREKIIIALMEQYQMEEEWLRQFNKDDLKEMLDDLLFKKSKKD